MFLQLDICTQKLKNAWRMLSFVYAPQNVTFSFAILSVFVEFFVSNELLYFEMF